MEPEIAKRALDMLDKSVLFAHEFIAKHGPQAWDVVLNIYRIRAVGYLLLGLACLAISLRSWTIANTLWEKERGKDWFDRSDWFIAAYVVSAIAMVPALFCLLDVWNYTTLFWPELTVAKDMLDKAMK